MGQFLNFIIQGIKAKFGDNNSYNAFTILLRNNTYYSGSTFVLRSAMFN